MAKTCFIIRKANKNQVDIDAIVGVDASKEHAKKTGGILVMDMERLTEMNGSALLQIFNVVSEAEGLPTTKRFESKKRGAERTFDLLQTVYGPRAKELKPITHKTSGKRPVTVLDDEREIYGRNARGINLEPLARIKGPRETSKRAQVLELLLRSNGATHSELDNLLGRGRNLVRVFLHDLNRRCGYGIKTIECLNANNRYKAYL